VAIRYAILLAAGILQGILNRPQTTKPVVVTTVFAVDWLIELAEPIGINTEPLQAAPLTSSSVAKEPLDVVLKLPFVLEVIVLSTALTRVSVPCAHTPY